MPYNLSNTKNLRYLESLPTKEAKLRYMVGGHVTVARVTQVEGNTLVHRYAAKIRGIIVGNNGEWLHDTPEEARAYGRKVLEEWREELQKMPAT